MLFNNNKLHDIHLIILYIINVLYKSLDTNVPTLSLFSQHNETSIQHGYITLNGDIIKPFS